MKRIITSFLLLSLVFVLNAQNKSPEATQGTDGTLTVTFSTNNAGTSTLTYYVAAIYILNSSGSLVNTLLYNTSNGDGSAADLPGWYTLIGSAWTTSATKLLTTTDAITGATKTSFYTNQNVYWGKTISVAGVPDGTYTVKFEICNATSGGGNLTKHSFIGTFVKGGTASSTPVTATLGFSGITLAWAPKNTAVNDVNLEKQYVAYPNPTRSTVYMSGFDIKQIEVCTLTGKHIFTTNQQTFNLSKLPKGIYMAKVTTPNGTFVKKIEKL